MATSISAQILVSPQDVFSTSSTQGTSLGAKATLGDGRSFRYCLAGGTSLVAGTLQQSSAQSASNYQNLAASAAAIGATQITFTTSTTVTASILAGGLLVTTTGTGVGYTYQIGGNTATSGATGLVVTLNDGLIIATDTTTRFDIIPNPFANVVINPATASSSPAGLAVFIVTNAQYGWLLVQGVGGVLADGAITVGTALVASNGTNGAVEPLAGVQAAVGTAVTDISTTEYGLVNFQLD